MRTVKLHHVAPLPSEKGYIGEEPSWDGIDGNYNIAIGKGLNWYNHVCDSKNFVKFFGEWIQTHRSSTAKKDLARLAKLSEKKVDGSLANVARMHLRGFPLNESHIQRINQFVDDLRVLDKVKTEATPTFTGPSVQDHMRIQVQSVLGEIDQAVDDFLVNGVAVRFDVLQGLFFQPTFKAPHLNIIEKYLNKYLNEWKEALAAMEESFWTDTSDQLAEGYAYVGKRGLKNAVEKFSTLMGVLTQESAKVKIQRIQKKRPVDKRKMIAKLKFLKEDKTLGLTSISPVDILGASSLWVYDRLKRKLGYYEAEFAGSLHVKGTSILGAKPSFQKTLRKPEEQLTEFTKLRKNQVATYFKAIKSKGQPLTGRTNSELILLRAD